MSRVLRAMGMSMLVWLAYALAPAQASTVWYGGSVQLIYQFSDGSFAIGVPNTLAVCSSSGSGSYLFVTPGANGVTTDGVKSLLANVMMAFATGRTIEVAYDDSSSSCYVNRILVQ